MGASSIVSIFEYGQLRMINNSDDISEVLRNKIFLTVSRSTAEDKFGVRYWFVFMDGKMAALSEKMVLNSSTALSNTNNKKN